MARRRSDVEWPSLEPVRSTRIYEEIVRQIRLLIADGHLKSGDRLPPERDLAERFRVSRTSVREAMRALESRGLIGIRPGEGAFVREVSVETLVEPLAPSELVVDGQRLIQVLTNLLMNAIKFSPPATMVQLRVESRSPGTVTFAVRDRGPGVSPEERDAIFDRFHQSESSAAHSEGAGLGLYIARQLTEAMGGWITLESEPGDGATFIVTIPTTRNLEVPAPLSGAGRAG